MRIDIERVEVNLSGSPVLRGVSTIISAGASAAIVGMSGAGKTTLLRCVAGLTKPSAGTVAIDGKAPETFYGRGLLSYLFQEPYLWSHLTVQQSLELTFRLLGHTPDASQIDELLHRVGLINAKSLYPYQLSVGMKARAAIARAFCVPPRVFLMDEPFAAIDPLRRLDLNRQVQRLSQEFGCTALWATHDVVEALQFATQIIAIAPPPAGTATILDLSGMPQIKDNASLPVEALGVRNHILGIIKGEVVHNKEGVLETV
jgi:ABC-type nitrate/sulfonate/bicarbonate transport system ATPase subunit